MDTQELRRLAEENLGFILQRAKEKAGRLSNEDAAAGQFFCRTIEAETGGASYPFFPSTLKDVDGALAAATNSVPHHP